MQVARVDAAYSFAHTLNVKLQQKRLSKTALFVVAIVLVVVGGAGYLVVTNNDRITTARERSMVEKTITNQLQPLIPQLDSMGFTNLTDLKTDCSYYTVEQPDPNSFQDVWESPGKHFSCSSGIDRLIKIPADKSKFIQQASSLDETLQANGWKMESDRSTIVWAKKISDGEAQANQAYSKKVDELDCNLSFWSAFSDPDPPATSVVVGCGKYN